MFERHYPGFLKDMWKVFDITCEMFGIWHHLAMLDSLVRSTIPISSFMARWIPQFGSSALALSRSHWQNGRLCSLRTPRPAWFRRRVVVPWLSRQLNLFESVQNYSYVNFDMLIFGVSFGKDEKRHAKLTPIRILLRFHGHLCPLPRWHWGQAASAMIVATFHWAWPRAKQWPHRRVSGQKRLVAILFTVIVYKSSCLKIWPILGALANRFGVPWRYLGQAPQLPSGGVGCREPWFHRYFTLFALHWHDFRPCMLRTFDLGWWGP